MTAEDTQEFIAGLQRAWQREQASARIYRALAAREPNESRRAVLLKLAATEDNPAEHAVDQPGLIADQPTPADDRDDRRQDPRQQQRHAEVWRTKRLQTSAKNYCDMIQCRWISGRMVRGLGYSAIHTSNPHRRYCRRQPISLVGRTGSRYRIDSDRLSMRLEAGRKYSTV